MKSAFYWTRLLTNSVTFNNIFICQSFSIDKVTHKLGKRYKRNKIIKFVSNFISCVLLNLKSSLNIQKIEKQLMKFGVWHTNRKLWRNFREKFSVRYLITFLSRTCWNLKKKKYFDFKSINSFWKPIKLITPQTCNINDETL